MNLRYLIFSARNLPRAVRAVSIDDKIRRKMLRDRRPYLTLTADKVRVLDYVGELTPTILPRVYQITGDANQVKWEELPPEFVVKSTHGCAGSVIASADGQPIRELLNPDGQLPRTWTNYRVLSDDISGASLGQSAVKDYLSWILKQRYGWGSPFAFTFEWAYRNIEAKLIVEELLTEDGEIPVDFRFFVINGRVSWIQRDYKRRGEHFSSVHLPDWTMLEVRYNYDLPPQVPPKPPNLELMLISAQRLAQDTDFCRVDLYDLGDRVVFGEITHYPRGGNNDFMPRSWANSAGSAWRPPWWYRT